MKTLKGERRGQTGDLRTQGTTQQQVLWLFFFPPLYPRFVAGEVSNPEIPMSVDKNSSKKSLLSLAKRPGEALSSKTKTFKTINAIL